MNITEFKNLKLDFSQLIEYTVKDSQNGRVTKPGYFIFLNKTVPPLQKDHINVEIPYIELAHWLDKNGSPKGESEIALEDIVRICKY